MTRTKLIDYKVYFWTCAYCEVTSDDFDTEMEAVRDMEDHECEEG